jgi:MFS family permease
VKTYLEILRVPGVARVVASQLLARFPFGMLTIAYLVFVEQNYHSYAIAGLALGASSLGQAVAGPFTSRLLGRFGIRWVISITVIVVSLANIAIVLLVPPVWLLLVLALIEGVSTPPVQPAVRTIYPKMVPSSKLTPLFSLDASAQELIWILGPVIAAVLAIQVSPAVAIFAAVAFFVGGGLWFVTSPIVGRVAIPRSRRRLGSVLRNRAVVVSTIVGLLLVASLGAVEAAIVSIFGDGSPSAGIVLAVFSVSSLIGGLALGHRPITQWSLAARMAIVAVGMMILPLSVNFWWLCAVLFVAGLGVAPSLTALFASVSGSVKFSDTAEAFAWLGTGQLIGVAGGSALAGFCIDLYGSQAALLAAGLLAVATTVAAVIGHTWLPDLRDVGSNPIPDTEPVRVVG